MDRSRVLVAVSVSVILGVTVLSGPVVGLVDLTRERTTTAGLGQGNATIDEVDAPATASLDRGLGSDAYYLEVPDARIRVAAIEGRPTVTYRISIPALGYSRTTTHFLDGDDAGRVILSMAGDTLAPARIHESSYDATLALVLRYDDTERVLVERNVTVEVTG